MRARLLATALGFAVALAAGSVPAQTTTPAAPPLTLRPAAGPPAPDADTAYGAYQRGLFLTAFKEASARLEKLPNDAAAMTLIGELHRQGLGLREDPARAAEWFRLAAGLGDPNAMFSLGIMSLTGRGQERSPEHAREWLEQAAERGHAAASYNLALLLLPSDEPADLKRAVALLRRAAEAEVADAQHALGVLYAKGRGVEPDKAEALRLFTRAAANGSVAGEVERAIALFNGDGAPASEPEAARLFRRAAFRGNAIAQNRLARLYVAGRGVPKNEIEAAAWHILASGQGLSDTWLDNALRNLPAADRARAEKIAAERSS
ncbi:SEL1-like repeat protein [Salinarimonas soli]|uniref:SEL1-like repeat protein n=1 Tax=Salinarimonas soli TaxID=1638099 RepID=A0A5B2V318_9HYPH|nr:SEL1-like repeat protein [Salinarimonas soli]KAA2233434.1 SEL1-like repeat protein [Salinarimonas soli]